MFVFYFPEEFTTWHEITQSYKHWIEIALANAKPPTAFICATRCCCCLCTNHFPERIAEYRSTEKQCVCVCCSIQLNMLYVRGWAKHEHTQARRYSHLYSHVQWYNTIVEYVVRMFCALLSLVVRLLLLPPLLRTHVSCEYVYSHILFTYYCNCKTSEQRANARRWQIIASLVLLLVRLAIINMNAYAILPLGCVW